MSDQGLLSTASHIWVTWSHYHAPRRGSIACKIVAIARAHEASNLDNIARDMFALVLIIDVQAGAVTMGEPEVSSLSFLSVLRFDG